MAFAQDLTRRPTALAYRFDDAVSALRRFRARRAAFNQTYNELAILSDRELNDLGIARSDIAAVARQAAAEV